MSVTVQASKHPLKAEWVYADVEPGQSIYEIAGGAPVVAFINGREVPEELHRLTQAKDGATVVLWPVPQGGDIFKSVLMIGIAFAAGPIAGSIVGKTSGMLFQAVKMGISFIGRMLVNSLIPPQEPAQQQQQDPFNRLQSITGASNKVAAFEPIPRVYGTFRFFPPVPMTAKPFTETAGRDEYLRMLVCLGYGPLEINGNRVGEGLDRITEETDLQGAIRIGDTNIELFDDVEFEIGRPDQMTLYTNQIIETNPSFTTKNDGFENEDDGPVTLPDGDSAVRTTDTGASEISVDFSGALYSINREATTTRASVKFKIEYRETGATNWILEKDDFVVASNKKETVRSSYRWKVPEGQYEVRVTRIETTHRDTSAFQNELTWNALRTIRSVRGFDVDGTICMALRIRATDQLNGRIENLSVLATSVLEAWDGTQWVEQPTSNPAWVYADIWSGTANRRPIDKSDLDTASLLDWANYCDTEGLEYNSVLDARTTTLAAAQEVTGAGLAAWQFNPDSTIGVVRDIPHTVPRMVISTRNSFDFSYELSSLDIPDALRVKFIDDFTWENTERLVFDDGFDESNAEFYETLDAKGCTDSDQAWKYGRFHLAQQRLRPERYTFKQEVQHLRYRRGDLLTLQNDVILVGLGAGRIKSVNSTTEIEVDEFFPMEDGTNYGIKIQRSNGQISTVGVANDAPGNTTLTLTSSVSNLLEDDLVIFGELGRESIDVKVTDIQPEGDFVASITCVPAAEEIENAWDGTIPAFDPVITERIEPERIPPVTPEIDEETLRGGATSVTSVTRDSTGSPTANLFVTVRFTSQFGSTQKTQARYRELGTTDWEILEPVNSTLIKIEDLNVGTTYEIQARGVKGEVFGDWSTAVQYTVEDTTQLAPTTPSITNLTQVDEQLPPIGTVQSYIVVEYQLGEGGPTPSLLEVKWEGTTVPQQTATYEPEAGPVRLPINTYGETISVEVRTRSVHGYWSSFSTAATITPADPNVTNQDLINFISDSISESELTSSLNTRLDDFGLEITELEDQYTVKIDNNGGVAGFGLANTANDDTGSPSFSEFYVNADRFAILPQGGVIGSDDVAPFIVQNNQVFIDNAVIADGSIDNAKIANAAIDRAKIQNGEIINAKIANSAVDNAKIDNAAISEAKIQNAAVDTLQIRGNAVTVPAFSFVNGPVSVIGSSWTTLDSVTSDFGGSPISVDASCIYFANAEEVDQNGASASLTLQLRLVAGGVVLRTFTLGSDSKSENNAPGIERVSIQFENSISVIDFYDSPTGNLTVSVQARAFGENITDADFEKIGLRALGVKR